jgi:hypothetical protein
MDRLLQELSELVGKEWARRWLEKVLARRPPHDGSSHQKDELHSSERQQADSERDQ